MVILDLSQVVVVAQHHLLPVRRVEVGCRPAVFETGEVRRAGKTAADQQVFQCVEPYDVVGRTIHFRHRAVVVGRTVGRRNVSETRAEVLAPRGPGGVAEPESLTVSAKTCACQGSLKTRSGSTDDVRSAMLEIGFEEIERRRIVRVALAAPQLAGAETDGVKVLGFSLPSALVSGNTAAP